MRNKKMFLSGVFITTAMLLGGAVESSLSR